MKILIAVIAYNEADSIRDVINDLQKNNFGYDIIVIDNSSFDNTKQICELLNVKVITHCINSGIDGTWKTFYKYAYENGYDIVCQFDGDGQHLACELPKIIEPVIKGEADRVIGSRFLTKEGFQSYFFRRIIIKSFAFWISIIIGYKINDVTSGFIALNKKIISFFANYYKHEISDPNVGLILTHYIGAKIIEVPVLMKARKTGRSYYGLINSLAYPVKGFINIVGCLLLKKQIKKEFGVRNEP